MDTDPTVAPVDLITLPDSSLLFDKPYLQAVASIDWLNENVEEIVQVDNEFCIFVHESLGDTPETIVDAILAAHQSKNESETESELESESEKLQQSDMSIPAPTFTEAANHIDALIRCAGAHDSEMLEHFLQLKTQLETNHARTRILRAKQTEIQKFFA